MMKTLLLTLSLLVCCGTMCSQTQEEMKAWQDNMTPGEQHQWLATMDGEWNANIKMWMDPSQPATESEGLQKNEMIMNGLYQRGSHTGTMMGMPFQGESISGYDNVKKKFFSTWIDNMGSGIMMMEGSYDEASKTLTMSGNMLDPMTGNNMDIKQVITYQTSDKNTFEMFMMMEGEEFKMMEIVYTRKK